MTRRARRVVEEEEDRQHPQVGFRRQEIQQREEAEQTGGQHTGRVAGQGDRQIGSGASVLVIDGAHTKPFGLAAESHHYS